MAWSCAFWTWQGHCPEDLTAAGTACTRLVQGEVSQYSLHRGMCTKSHLCLRCLTAAGAGRVSSLGMWLLAGYSCSSELSHTCVTLAGLSWLSGLKMSVWNWEREAVERNLGRVGWKVLRGRFVQNPLLHVWKSQKINRKYLKRWVLDKAKVTVFQSEWELVTLWNPMTRKSINVLWGWDKDFIWWASFQ